MSTVRPIWHAIQGDGNAPFCRAKPMCSCEELIWVWRDGMMGTRNSTPRALPMSPLPAQHASLMESSRSLLVPMDLL